MVRPVSGMDRLRLRGIRVFVLTASGALVPIDPATPVKVASLPHGANRSARALLRLVTSNRLDDADLVLALEFSVVPLTDAGGATPIVLATRYVTATLEVAQTDQ